MRVGGSAWSSGLRKSYHFAGDFEVEEEWVDAVGGCWCLAVRLERVRGVVEEKEEEEVRVGSCGVVVDDEMEVAGDRW